MSKVILNQAEPAQIVDPINLDAAIQELQNALKANIAWLSRVYGRARLHPEKLYDKQVLLPKVYYGNKEYLNILLNDTVPAQGWFQVIGAEQPLEFHPGNTIQKYQVPVAFIVWLDLKKIALENQDYIYLEIPKRQIHNILGRYPNVTITKVFDENAKDIFKEYTTQVDKEQFLTYPKAGLRFEFNLTYNYNC